MRAATNIRTGPVHRAKRRPPGRLDSHRNWTDRRGLVTNTQGGAIVTTNGGGNHVNVVATTYLYDDSGDVQSVTAPAGDTSDSYASGSSHYTARITDSIYDLDHRLTASIADASSTDPTATGTSSQSSQTDLRTGYLYDPDGNVIQQFDPRAYASSLTPSNGNFSTIINYDQDDRTSKVFAPRADTANPSAVPSGQCTASTPSSPTTLIAFGSGATVCKTNYNYDGDGNLTSLILPTQTSSNTPTITATYTKDNLLGTVTPPNPDTDTGAPASTTTTLYDGRGEPVDVIDPDSASTLTQYSGNELPIDVRDAAGSSALQISETVYDANGDTNANADYVGTTPWIAGPTSAWQVTSAVNNSDGTKGSSSDVSTDVSGGDLTTYGYDLDANTTTVVSPVSNTLTAAPTTVDAYTPDGLLASTTQTVVAGTETRTTAYLYDAASRKISQQITDSSKGGGGTRSFAYYPDDLTYTDAGRSTPSSDTMTNGVGTVTDSYDEAGNLTDVADSAPYGASTSRYGSDVTIKYTLDSLVRNVDEGDPTIGYPQSETESFDGSGALSTRAVTTSGTTDTTTYTNLDAGLPSSVAQATGETWSLKYDPTGRATSVTYPDNQTLTNTYYSSGSGRNNDEELSKSILKTSGGGTILTEDYTNGGANTGYDGLDRVLTQAAGGNTFTYAYNPEGEVCQFTTGTGAASIRNVSYDRDRNRTGYGNQSLDAKCKDGSVSTAPSGADATFSYNLDDSINSNNGLTAVYDAAGRMKSDGTASYCYDGFDQTELVLAGGGTCPSSSSSAYSYDGLSRQISSGSETFGYDGTGSDVLSDSKNQGGTPSNAIYYVRNADQAPLGIGYLTASGGGLQQYVTSDGNGSVGEASSSGGSTACTLRYDPFGTLSTLSSCSSTAYLGTLYFNSNRQDPTTKNYQDGNRTYIPTLAAFTTPDTYGPGSGQADGSIGTDPLTADTYTYVNGDPINLVDPSGHTCASRSSEVDSICPGSKKVRVPVRQRRNSVVVHTSDDGGTPPSPSSLEKFLADLVNGSTGYCIEADAEAKIVAKGVSGSAQLCLVEVGNEIGVTDTVGGSYNLSLSPRSLLKLLYQGLANDGEDAGGGFQIERTNVTDLSQLDGVFTQYSFAAGDEIGGVVGGISGGHLPDGRQIRGAFVSVGLREGAATSVGSTYTVSHKLGGLDAFAARTFFNAINQQASPVTTGVSLLSTLTQWVPLPF